MIKNKKKEIGLKNRENEGKKKTHNTTHEMEMELEEYKMKVSILTSRNRDLMETNKKLTSTVEGSLVIAHQLLEKRYYLKNDLAKMVCNEFEVNPEDDSFKSNYNNLLSVLKALRKVEYYDKSKEDAYELYKEKIKEVKKYEESEKKWKERERVLQSTIQFKDHELSKTKKEVEEKTNELDSMRTKLDFYEIELKKMKEKEKMLEKMLFEKQTKEVALKEEKKEQGLLNTKQILINGNQPVGVIIGSSGVEKKEISESELKAIEKLKEKFVKEINSKEKQENINKQQENKVIEKEEKVKEIKKKEVKKEEEKTQIQEVKEKTEKSKKIEKEANTIKEKAVKQKENENTIENGKENKRKLEKEQEKAIEEVKKEMIKETNEPIFITLLKEKEKVEVEKNPESKIDAWVYKNDEKIPVCYIDYEIEDSKIFEKIVGEKNKIYLVFNDKKHYNKGNPKFITWLYKTGKINQIEFSFTMEEELKVIGLNELQKL